MGHVNSLHTTLVTILCNSIVCWWQPGNSINYRWMGLWRISNCNLEQLYTGWTSQPLFPLWQGLGSLLVFTQNPPFTKKKAEKKHKHQFCNMCIITTAGKMMCLDQRDQRICCGEGLPVLRIQANDRIRDKQYSSGVVFACEWRNIQMLYASFPLEH